MKITLFLAAILLAGCQVVPEKRQVTDLATGKTFTTYNQSYWAKENMLGYYFFDLASKQWVMLKTYTIKVLQPFGSYGLDSPEAKEYKQELSEGPLFRSAGPHTSKLGE